MIERQRFPFFKLWQGPNGGKGGWESFPENVMSELDVERWMKVHQKWNEKVGVGWGWSRNRRKEKDVLGWETAKCKDQRWERSGHLERSSWKTGMEEAQGLEETEEIQIIDQVENLGYCRTRLSFIGIISLADVSPALIPYWEIHHHPMTGWIIQTT